MEVFGRSRMVRLRSHHDKFLLADEDQESVCQERDGLVRRARWRVEPLEGSNLIRLKSCYGMYLTASDENQFLGMTGKKVLQSIPKRLDSSIEWEPIQEGCRVKLRSRYGHFLRANGGLPPWRNSITHDIPHRTATQDWILWAVDVIEAREKKAPEPIVSASRRSRVLQSPSPETNLFTTASQPSPALSPKMSARMSPTRQMSRSSNGSPKPVKSVGRQILYKLASEIEDADEAIPDGNSFSFKETEVEALKVRLAEAMGLEDEFILCSRNPFNRKLYPLKLHLPPNNAPMNLFVVASSSKAAKEIASRDSPQATD